MSLLAPSADFVYGNTRLRARKAALLKRADYEALLGKDLDGLLGALAASAYRPELEVALSRFHGLRRLHEALRLHLVRALEEMRGFYEGPARELVDLFLSRWDLHNLLALLRGQARGATPDEVLANVFPIGRLDDAAVREVARQSEFAAAVQLLVSWRLPDPESARSLLAAWPDYERTEDLAALEHTLAAHHLRRVEATPALAGVDAEPLRRVLQWEVDARNVLIAVRLRAALERGELAELPAADELGPFLPAGSIPNAKLDAAVRYPAPGDCAAALAEAARVEGWRAPLERWGRGGDLVELQRELEAQRTHEAVALFYRGDPLSVAVPVAYAVAKEAEARNLRVLGDGAARGTHPDVLRAHLALA